ncbi:MAG: amidohydrolase family protein [Ilumatobacter sp.]|nr:amidohydrolase family protein [Ilumatobacter sp.]
MIAFPFRKSEVYEFLRAQAKDDETKSGELEMPAGFLFDDVGDDATDDEDVIERCIAEMDASGVAAGLFNLGDVALDAQRRHPDRVHLSLEIDPNDIGGAVRAIRAAHTDHGIKAVTSFPAGCNPQVPISDRRYYPIYQTCVDVGIPICLTAGVPGPRVPGDCQHVRHFDQVCFDFPELTVVMRHGGEPDEALAVKLMLKYPGLHYSTSAFSPKYYPQAIVNYANTRGADKVMYAGYYPMGLSLRQIFADLPDVPFRDHVWEPFLRDNARRVFDL